MDGFDHLVQDLRRGRLTRRRFLTNAAALGVSTAVAVDMLGRYMGDALAQPRPQGSIVIGQPASILQLDPQYTQLSTERSTHHAIFDPLLEVDPSMRSVAHLATSWKAEDERTWTLNLRPGVKFHNGEPFNAEVVKFNVERVLRPGYQRFRFLQFLDKADVTGEFVIRITTKTPFPMFLDRMAQFYMVPMRYVQQVGDQAFNRKPIGSGPWKFVEWVRDSYVRLEANEQYWRAVPRAKAQIWKTIPDPATRVGALLAGEVDFLIDLPPDDFDTVKGNANLNALSVESLRTPFLFLYPESPTGRGRPLRDVRVRRAINHAINVQGIIDSIVRGKATRTASLMTPKYKCFDASVRPYEHNMDLARRLLAESGYPNGFEIDFAAWSTGPSPKPIETSQAIVADLARVGIRAQLQTPDLSTLLTLQRRRAFPAITLWSYGGAGADPDDKFWPPYSVEATNHLFYTDDMQELIAKGRATPNVVERCRVYGQLQRIVREEAIIVPLFAQHDLYGARKGLEVEILSNQVVKLNRATARR
jgi:peptide/nickel transport system substrate-binding protein